MTDLQRIEISGFKGIEHLEFEPSGVNLITGRNNTGKTSLLEAIALAFDPTYVEEFGEDIDSLIHRDFEECEIVVETGEGTREMGIRHPTEKEAKRFFISAIRFHVQEASSIGLEMIEEQTTFVLGDKGEGIQEEFESTIVGTAQSVVNERLDSEPRGRLKNECLVFSINQNQYPYLVFGREMEELWQQITKQVMADGLDFGEQAKDIPEIALQKIIHPTLGQRGPGGGFLETPSVYNDVTFLKSKNLLSAPEFEPDSGDAIKRDDLGDHLKETGLADELKTFNLDDLVFEKDDGEKYAVPYDFMGDGFKTVVGLLWELMDDEIEDQIVLLEEPENHMHPGYVLNVVHFLVELARDEDVQLFVTTHNKDFIDAFFNENRAGEQEEFLEEEFTLLQLQSDSALVEDYETAREDLEELHLDLRGI